jgi:preprotein translocase subunit SecA
MGDIRGDIVKSLMSISLRQEPVLVQPLARNIRTNRDGGSNGQQQTVRHTNTRPGRNDLCHCGSGKKYKHCHMRADQRQDEAAARQPAATR